MNKFTIIIESELNKDNLDRRIKGNDMLLSWLKIWSVRIEQE